MKKKIAKIALVACLFVSLGIVAYFSYKYHREKILFEKRKAAWFALYRVLDNKVASFEGNASFVVEDLNTGWKLSLNKERLFPSASLAKIPIMLAVFQAAQEGKLNLQDTLVLKASCRTGGSGVLKKMPLGLVFSVEELMEFMISESDNTATNMLINLLGFDYLNNYFREFGLKNTNLSRKMLDFKYRRNGIENYTCAEDIAYILGKIYRKEFFSQAISGKCLALLRQQKINDRIPARLPVVTIVAHKTGLERRVCHDAGIVFTPKGDFLICVLTQDANSIKAAKEFISGVALDVYEYFQRF